MNKAQRVKAVMKQEETDFVPAGFWFHYKPDFSVEEMIQEHLKLYEETDMDIIKIMQDYPYPVTGEIHCAEDWYQIGIRGTDSEELKKMTDVIRGIRQRAGNDVLIFQTMFGPHLPLMLHNVLVDRRYLRGRMPGPLGPKKENAHRFRAEDNR